MGLGILLPRQKQGDVVGGVGVEGSHPEVSFGMDRFHPEERISDACLGIEIPNLLGSVQEARGRFGGSRERE